MDGAARRLQVSPGRIAAVGTTDFVRVCARHPVSGPCRVLGAACLAVVHRGSIAVQAGPAARIHTVGRDHGRAACVPMAGGLLRAVDLAVGIPVAGRMVAAIRVHKQVVITTMSSV